MFTYDQLVGQAQQNPTLFTGSGDNTQGTVNNWIYVGSQLYGQDMPSGHFITGWSDSQLNGQLVSAKMFWNFWDSAVQFLDRAKLQMDTVVQYPPQLTTVAQTAPTSLWGTTPVQTPENIVASQPTQQTVTQSQQVQNAVTGGSQQTNTTNNTQAGITDTTVVTSNPLTQEIFGIPVWLLGVGAVAGFMLMSEEGGKHRRFE